MTASHHHDRDHSWHTRSTHATSEGLVTYQACRCGGWRILEVARGAEIARSPY